MNTMHIAMTETIPSFGMPDYGSAFVAVVGAAVCQDTTAVVLAARTSAMGRIKGDFPGTSAWRPPSR